MNLQPINASASPEVQMNENFETLDALSVFGLRQPVTTGLTWGYYGGRYNGNDISAGTLTLTDDADNYIVVERSTGVISTTDGSDALYTDTDYAAVYLVTTASGAVTGVVDMRMDTNGLLLGGAAGGGGGITALTGDVTASGTGSVAATIANDAVTYAKMQNVSATARVLGRKTASAGDAEEVTLSELLDFIGSAAQGDILYRDSSGWARLGAGTSGHFLKTQGAAANPVWDAASGGSGGTKSIGTFTPMTSQPPASNYSTLDTRNSHPLNDFDGTTEEATAWNWCIPEGLSLASGITADIYWTATSATSGDAKFGVAFEKLNTDIDSDSFDTETTGTGTANGTSGIPTKTSIACTTIDSLAALDPFRFKVARKAADGADTINGTDVEILMVHLRAT